MTVLLTLESAWACVVQNAVDAVSAVSARRIANAIRFMTSPPFPLSVSLSVLVMRRTFRALPVAEPDEGRVESDGSVPVSCGDTIAALMEGT